MAGTSPARTVNGSERVGVGLAGADAHRVLEIEHEDLAVADLAGLGGGGDRLDQFVGPVGRNRDLDLHLGPEIHRIFGAAIDLGVAALAPIALDLGHGEAGDAEIADGVEYAVNFLPKVKIEVAVPADR